MNENDVTQNTAPPAQCKDRDEGFQNVPSRIEINDNKAGMDGLNKEKINQVILEATKGSRFYDNEVKRDASVNERIGQLKKLLTSTSQSDLELCMVQADAVLQSLERSCDLSRFIVHIDMDAFYAAVEMRDNPKLCNVPMAVGGESMLSTSNYLARRYGVRAAMPGFIARKLCPQLVIVPCNFAKYRAVSRIVRGVLSQYDANMSMAGLDEAYLDLTEHVRKRQTSLLSERTFPAAAAAAHACSDPGDLQGNGVASCPSAPSSLPRVGNASSHDTADNIPVLRAPNGANCDEDVAPDEDAAYCKSAVSDMDTVEGLGGIDAGCFEVSGCNTSVGCTEASGRHAGAGCYTAGYDGTSDDVNGSACNEHVGYDRSADCYECNGYDEKTICHDSAIKDRGGNVYDEGDGDHASRACHVEQPRDAAPMLHRRHSEAQPPVPGGCTVQFGLDVSEAVHEMRHRVHLATRVTASAGIAPNCMLAKVCSDRNKPNGQYWLPSDKDAIVEFVQVLPVRKISGIGKVTEKILGAFGITTCGDLHQKRAELRRLFSDTAFEYFMSIAMGIGSSWVGQNEDGPKSKSVERTFSEMSVPSKLYEMCHELSAELSDDLKHASLKGRTVTLKIKTVNFEMKTRARSINAPTADGEEIYSVASSLLKVEIKLCAPQPLRLRLMGVRMSNFLEEGEMRQLSMATRSASLVTARRAPFHKEDSRLPVEAAATINEMGEDGVETLATVTTGKVSSLNRPKNEARDFDQLYPVLGCDGGSAISVPAEYSGLQKFTCPVCGLVCNGSLDRLNGHIDVCLRKHEFQSLITSAEKRKRSDCTTSNRTSTIAKKQSKPSAANKDILSFFKTP